MLSSHASFVCVGGVSIEGLFVLPITPGGRPRGPRCVLGYALVLVALSVVIFWIWDCGALRSSRCVL